ncbi:MAG: MATE family efflux transporter [Tannerellaceae bacterium]|jgi:putative MATE family efflux protein|nr:MATE family efflux transporter [Tannerellaceae bacterium]
MKRLWDVSYPIFLSLVAQNVINVTDTAFLGRVGEIELGASAMGGLFYICCFTLAFGFSTGAQIVIARRNGEGNYAKIGPVAVQTLFFLLSLVTVLYITIRLCLPTILPQIITSSAVRQATADYLSPRLFGLFFSFTNVVFRAFYVGITRTKVLTWNAIFMAGANVVLDYLLIFGNESLHIPALGIRGAAIASVLAEGGSLLFFFLYTCRTVDTRRYGLRHIPRPDWPLFRRIFSVSFYTMLQHFVSISTFFFFFLVIERLGERSLAIANIARSIYIILFIPVQSLAAAVNTLVSNVLGEGLRHQVIPLIRKTTFVSIALVTAASALICLFANTLVSLYTTDRELILQTVPSVYVISFAMVFNAAAAVVFNGVTGTGNIRIAFLIEFLTLLVYVVYVYLLGIHLRLPVHICFTGESVYAIVLLGLSILVLRRRRFADV